MPNDRPPTSGQPTSGPPLSGVIPCSTVLLTSVAHGRQDVMTATAIFVTEDPPIFSVSVSKRDLSHFNIGTSGEFTANIAASDQAGLAAKLGSVHGTEVDKIERFNVPIEPGEKIAAPRITGSYASLECRVVTAHEVGDFVVYLAEVLTADVDETKTPLVWHQGRFHTLGEVVTPG